MVARAVAMLQHGRCGNGATDRRFGQSAFAVDVHQWTSMLGRVAWEVVGGDKTHQEAII